MTVDEYLDASPEPQQTTLRALRSTLRTILPEATEQLSYGVPAFMVNGKAVAGYAHAKRHCSYFPHSGQVLRDLDPALLEPYDWSGGTLRFPVDEPLPEAVVQALVAEKLRHLG